MRFYTLKDFVHEQGLNMGEFKRLDPETQEKWREVHQKKLKERLAEADEAVFHICFLGFEHHITEEEFEKLPLLEQDELRRKYTEYKKQQQKENQRRKENSKEVK